MTIAAAGPMNPLTSHRSLANGDWKTDAARRIVTFSSRLPNVQTPPPSTGARDIPHWVLRESLLCAFQNGNRSQIETRGGNRFWPA